MTRKKNKPISYDAMVKFFLQYHNIPTKKDFDKLLDQLNRMEQMIKALSNAPALRSASDSHPARGRKSGTSATDVVIKVIKSSGKGVGIAEIQKKTGFDEKKLRNIIYRLNKSGKIRRKSRGLYIV